MSGCFSTKPRLDEIGGELNYRQRLDVDDLEPRRLGEQAGGRRQQASVDDLVAHQVPGRRRLLLLVRALGIHRVGLELGLADELDIVAVHIESVLLEEQPVVETWMRAAGRDLRPNRSATPLMPEFLPHHELVVHLIDGLAEIDPAVAARAMAVG